MNVYAKLALTITCLAVSAIPALGQKSDQAWLTMPDKVFAAKYADMAFNGSLEDRQKLAWMCFARVNQLIDDPPKPDDKTKGGMSNSGKVPLWMAWPTDPETFDTAKPFQFDAAPHYETEYRKEGS